MARFLTLGGNLGYNEGGSQKLLIPDTGSLTFSLMLSLPLELEESRLGLSSPLRHPNIAKGLVSELRGKVEFANKQSDILCDTYSDGENCYVISRGSSIKTFWHERKA